MWVIPNRLTFPTQKGILKPHTFDTRLVTILGRRFAQIVCSRTLKYALNEIKGENAGELASSICALGRL